MNAIAMSVVKEQHAAERALDSSVNSLGAAPLGAPALGSMGEASHVPVPLKPTAAMLASGSRAGGVSVETAWKIYLAMIKEAV